MSRQSTLFIFTTLGVLGFAGWALFKDGGIMIENPNQPPLRTDRDAANTAPTPELPEGTDLFAVQALIGQVNCLAETLETTEVPPCVSDHQPQAPSFAETMHTLQEEQNK